MTSLAQTLNDRHENGKAAKEDIEKAKDILARIREET